MAATPTSQGHTFMNGANIISDNEETLKINIMNHSGYYCLPRLVHVSLWQKYIIRSENGQKSRNFTHSWFLTGVLLSVYSSHIVPRSMNSKLDNGL